MLEEEQVLEKAAQDSCLSRDVISLRLISTFFIRPGLLQFGLEALSTEVVLQQELYVSNHPGLGVLRTPGKEPGLIA